MYVVTAVSNTSCDQLFVHVGDGFAQRNPEEEGSASFFSFCFICFGAAGNLHVGIPTLAFAALVALPVVATSYSRSQQEICR